MKYKFYEKLTDFFRSRVFCKANLAIVAVMSIVLNIVLAGVVYGEQRELEMFLSLYAPENGQTISTAVPAEENTATQKVTSQAMSVEATTSETPSQTEPASQEAPDVIITEKAEPKEESTSATTVSAETQQGAYYVTNSGTKYHKGSCGYLKKSKIAISLSDAKAKGYSPCSRCIK